MTLAEDVLKRHTPHVLVREACQECDAYRLAVMVRGIEALAEEFREYGVGIKPWHAADRILAITRRRSS